MSKSTKRAGKNGKKSSDQDWPLVVIAWIFGLTLFGYVFGRIAFDTSPHPIHWAFGLGGGVLGYSIGWLWYRWRGDIV